MRKKKKENKMCIAGDLPLSTAEKEVMSGNSLEHDWIVNAINKYESMLLKYAYNMTGRYDRAQDVVQDTFLKLCKADREKIEYLKAWLFKVCRNRALEIIRKEQKMQPLTDVLIDKKPAEMQSPYDMIERSDSFSRAISLIEALPAKQKEIVYLKFQSNLSYKEISEVAEVSISNVGVILHTAMKTLRGSLHS
jgi:RNA polymerase sigma-70 factor (ECF subfamily)